MTMLTARPQKHSKTSWTDHSNAVAVQECLSQSVCPVLAVWQFLAVEFMGHRVSTASNALQGKMKQTNNSVTFSRTMLT